MTIGDYTKTEWVNGQAPGISAPRLNNIENKIEEIDTTLLNDLIPYGVTTGSANTYAVTIDPPPIAYIEGMALAVKINIDSTGASTINVDGLGAKSIKKPNGTDVNNLKAGGIYTLRYDGANFILQGEGASGNAVASDLLSGKTASTDAGEITGTMVDNGTVNITPGTSNQSIAAGKHSGSGVVYGDANLVSTNIKAGVNIFGVAGNSNVVDTSAGDAVAAQILSGKKAYVGGALVNGSMTNRGAHNITPAASNVAIPAGYHNGSGVVYAIPHSSQTYSTPGTYTFTVPEGVTQIYAVCGGGGGGGGGAVGNYDSGGNNIHSTAGGGGAGGGCSGWCGATVTPGQQITVTVGAGGNDGGFHGAMNTPTSEYPGYTGGAGGTSSVAGVCSAAGGNGGNGGYLTNNTSTQAPASAGGGAGTAGFGGAIAGVGGTAASADGQTAGTGGAGASSFGGAGGNGAPAQPFSVGTDGGAGKVIIVW